MNECIFSACTGVPDIHLHNFGRAADCEEETGDMDPDFGQPNFDGVRNHEEDLPVSFPDLGVHTTCVITSLSDSLVAKGMQVTSYVYIYRNYRLAELPWNSVYTWIAAAFCFDFGYYWAHRAAHEVNLFWSAHQVHHSSEEYNLTTAARQAVFQDWCNMVSIEHC